MIKGSISVISGLTIWLIPASSVLAEQPAETTVSVRYESQTQFSCSEQTFNIPSYFPYTSKWPTAKLFLTASPAACSAADFKVVLGKSADCLGGNSCREASFSISKFSIADKTLFAELENTHTPIKLSNGTVGYFIPWTCGANCDESKLIWQSNGHVLVIGTHNGDSQETIAELTKAANSYQPANN